VSENQLLFFDLIFDPTSFNGCPISSLAFERPLNQFPNYFLSVKKGTDKNSEWSNNLIIGHIFSSFQMIWNFEHPVLEWSLLSIVWPQ
jgi:hypothetical protein